MRAKIVSPARRASWMADELAIPPSRAESSAFVSASSPATGLIFLDILTASTRALSASAWLDVAGARSRASFSVGMAASGTSGSAAARTTASERGRSSPQPPSRRAGSPPAAPGHGEQGAARLASHHALCITFAGHNTRDRKTRKLAIRFNFYASLAFCMFSVFAGCCDRHTLHVHVHFISRVASRVADRDATDITRSRIATPLTSPDAESLRWKASWTQFPSSRRVLRWRSAPTPSGGGTARRRRSAAMTSRKTPHQNPLTTQPTAIIQTPASSTTSARATTKTPSTAMSQSCGT